VTKEVWLYVWEVVFPLFYPPLLSDQAHTLNGRPLPDPHQRQIVTPDFFVVRYKEINNNKAAERSGADLIEDSIFTLVVPTRIWTIASP
jgi:hypothetical protein